MRKTRRTLAVALAAGAAVAAFAGPASAATSSTTAPVTGAVIDTLTVAAAAPSTPLVLTPGGTSPAASAVVTITDTTPATPHSLSIADLSAAAGHTAGHMDNTTLAGGTGPAHLANALHWSASNAGPFSSLSGTAATVMSGGTLAVDPITVWFQQSVNSTENLVALETYGLTATYTVNG
jgi:hypothetical protein